MKRPKKHTIKSHVGDYNYLIFDSVFAFNDFVDQQGQNLSSHNNDVWKTIQVNAEGRIAKASEWYGTPVPKSISELQKHTSFLGMHLLKKILPQIKDQFTKYLDYLDTHVLPKPKIAYNDRGLGIFCFDRAAMGMYKSFPINTSTALDSAISQLHIALNKKKLRTSVKKVFAHFEHKKSSYPSLQLYIMAGGNSSVEGNSLLYVGLACGLLVEFMELRGISVEVNVLIGTHFGDQNIVSQVRVKRFEDRLDKNQLLLMASDPRYFRFRGFKALIAMSNYFELLIPYGLGRIEKNIGTNFLNAVNPNGFVFEQSYAMNSAVKEVHRIITHYKNKLDDKN